jgi:amino acid adenylation domain-containing protein
MIPDLRIRIAGVAEDTPNRLAMLGCDTKPGLSECAEAAIAGYCAPRNAIETLLAEMWRTVLKLERAGIHDNFFDSGGDSVLASQLVAQIRQTLGVELSASHLFQLPTIAQLAEFITAKRLISAEERAQLLAWGQNPRPFPTGCVHELFEQQVAKTPDAVAVVFEDASMSYAELNRRANQLAHYLRELGVKPDERVAICVERGFETIMAALAVLKAGGAYVPLDPTYPADRLSFLLKDSTPVALLTQKLLEKLFLDIDGKLPVLDLTAKTAAWHKLSESNPDPGGIELNPRHLAYVIYTSGSTGAPKGVLIEHRGLTNRLVWMQDAFGLNSNSIVLQKTSFGFDVSVWELFAPLLTGARVVMIRQGGDRDPAYLIAVMLRNSITMVNFVPAALQLILEQSDTPKCTSLVHVLCGGETMSAALAGRFRERLPNAILHNMYGPTEATIDVTSWPCTSLVPENEIVPIGRPNANARIYILNPFGEPVPQGVAGEIYIGGIQVARGYHHRPELTAEKFPADPFASEPGARMYRTGDQGRWLADGNIEFLGRNDFQVKIRGFRIELGEIEARLTACPGVEQAVVTVREDSPGDKRLIAYYTSVLKEKPPVAEKLRSLLSKSLPEHMVPAAYVLLDAMPLTAHGKLDRRALPVPTVENIATTVEYVAPRTPLERDLAAIWRESLELERVGIGENFFDIGGHSLSAMRVVVRIRSVLNMDVPVACLFQNPTIESLASTIEGMRSSVPNDDADLLRLLEEIEAMPALNAEGS